MRMIIDGHTLPTKNLDTARIRDVAELQQQTGWKLKELRVQSMQNESINAAVLTFLTLRGGGVQTTWDDVLDRSFGDFELVQEPGDSRNAEVDEADPQKPSEASAPDGDAPGEKAPQES